MPDITVESAIQITLILAGCASCITGLELYFDKGIRGRRGLLDASLLRALRPKVAPFQYVVYSPGLNLACALLGILTALSSFLPSWSAKFFVSLLAAVLLVQARSLQFGRDGSDEMAVMVVVPVAISGLLGSDHRLGEAALAFICFQACLSYLASGVWKIFGSYWRSGRAVTAILLTESYGRISLGRLAERQPFVFNWITVGALLFGFCFHLTVACIMGLNRFTPWFAATYPALYFVALHVDAYKLVMLSVVYARYIFALSSHYKPGTAT